MPKDFAGLTLNESAGLLAQVDFALRAAKGLRSLGGCRTRPSRSGGYGLRQLRRPRPIGLDALVHSAALAKIDIRSQIRQIHSINTPLNPTIIVTHP